jgi:hypothetical protein
MPAAEQLLPGQAAWVKTVRSQIDEAIEKLSMSALCIPKVT